MDVLGHSPADLGDDVVLVSRIIDYEQLAPNVENLWGELQRKQVVLTNSQREIEKEISELQRVYESKLTKLQQGYSQIEGRWKDAKAARRDLGDLRDKWDAIASGKTGEQIQNKRREDYAAIATKLEHGPRVPAHVSRDLAESVGITVGEPESGLAGSPDGAGLDQ